jgi:light-harvesting complex I chlorophyll a/b binding protein 1
MRRASLLVVASLIIDKDQKYNLHIAHSILNTTNTTYTKMQCKTSSMRLLNFLFLFIISETNALSFLGNKRRAPIPLSEEMGKSPALSYEYFDPFNFATDDNFAILREAELKHGRIAMLAVIGNVSGTDLWRASFDNQLSPLSFVDPSKLLLSPGNNLSFEDIPVGLKTLTTIPLVGWIQIIVFVGVLERRVFVQKDPRDMPGDYGIGYFGVRNKAQNERSLRSELENGRLAMVAFVGQVVAELVTGDTVMEQVRHTLDYK